VTWSLYRWTWRLESPLYVGMPPAGSVNRCRLYVPARALWGAITAEIARAQAQSGFPDYKEVGERLLEHARFTYLFPAEREREDWRAWLPRYVPEEGLVWEHEGEGAGVQRLADRRFRARLVSTRPSTAIEPSSDTAAEGSLRETECINTRWRDQHGVSGGPVGLVGYVFIHKGLDQELRENLEQLEAIVVGGDSRYGFGQLRRVAKNDATSLFGCRVELGERDPQVKTERVLAHAATNCRGPSDLRGEMEMLRGWDYGKKEHWHVKSLLWVPGSCAQSPQMWRIEHSGRWSGVP
jgi:hypothetical protein